MAQKQTIFLFLFLAVAAFAQPKPDSLQINTLEPVHLSRFHISDSLLQVPASIGIVSQKTLLRNNNADITPAINSIAGVLMQSGSYNTNRITIRGIGARTPYGTNKIRAFYGSIPLTSGDSETTIEDIDIENIEQVEIIKGTLSSLYGAGLGGAILISPKLSGGYASRASISSTHGSYGLLKNSIGFGLNRKTASLNLSYHKLETGGWRENSAYNREGVTLAGELFRSKNSKLAYFGNYTYLKAYIASSIDKNTFEHDPKAAAFTWKASKGFEQYEAYLGGISYESTLFTTIKNTTSVYVNHKESDEPRPFDILRQNTTGYGARTQFSGHFDPRQNTSFIVGMEYFRDNFKGRTLENLYQTNAGNGSLPGNQLTQTYQNRTFYNLFAQFRAQLSRHFEVQAGANANKTLFDLNEALPEQTFQKYAYDWIVSPQLSLLYHPGAFSTLYFSASRGFSTPAIEETLAADGKLNPNIKPENGFNLEVGAKGWLFEKALFAEIAAYRMEIKDLLVAQRVGNDQYVGVNAGKTLHQGIELTLNYSHAIGEFFSWNPYAAASVGDYTFKEFQSNGSDYSGKALTGVPKKKVNAGIVLNSWFGLYLSVDFQFVDAMPLNDANADYSSAYRLWNLKAGYKVEIFKGFSAHLAAGINNASDENYAVMVLVNATGSGNNAPRYYYPGTPQNFFGSAAFAYAF